MTPYSVADVKEMTAEKRSNECFFADVAFQYSPTTIIARIKGKIVGKFAWKKSKNRWEFHEFGESGPFYGLGVWIADTREEAKIVITTFALNKAGRKKT